MKLLATLFVLLCIGVGAYAEDVVPGCDSDSAMPSQQFDAIYAAISSTSFEFKRQEILNEQFANVTIGINANQTTLLLDLFKSNHLKSEIVTALAPYILGFSVDELVTILSSLSFESTKLEILEVVIDFTTNLYVDGESQKILEQFTFSSNKEAAQEIIDNASPRSCVWGDVTVYQQLDFAIDVSGSMAQGFKAADGQTYTRLSFVVSQLNDVLVNALKPSQEFNIISFSSSASEWEPSVVPATKENVALASQWTGKLRANGGTNMAAAVTMAAADEKVRALYLLSDGEPNDAQAVINAAKAWGKPINTIVFSAGGSRETGAEKFMRGLAELTGGVYRSLH